MQKILALPPAQPLLTEAPESLTGPPPVSAADPHAAAQPAPPGAPIDTTAALAHFGLTL